MSKRDELRLALCKTYLLFQEAAKRCPAGSIDHAVDNLADALHSFGYLPSEAEGIVAEYQEQQPYDHPPQSLLFLYQLDDFTRAYLECVLWAECDENDESGDDTPLDQNYDIWDFAPEALVKAIADCKRFQEENAADLALYNHPQWTAAELGGHDFHLTRNGHGCGFWDRDDCLPEDARERLTAASEKWGECYAYVSDGLIYFD